MQDSILLTDNNIIQLNALQVLGRDVIDAIYDMEDELERTRIKAVIASRAKQLGVEKEFATIVKAYDQADRKLAAQYAKNNSKIQLRYDNNGKPLKTIENFLIIIRNDIYFADLKFNLLTYSPERTEYGKNIRWTDADDSMARSYIEATYYIHNAQKLDDALRIIFAEREYHPIRDIIEAVKWDGIERIPGFLTKWLKCEDTPYSKEVSRLIFSGGINRIYNPGCKFDDVPVLIGVKQGEGKSTFVRWLALQDDFFGEVCEIEGQRGMEALEGVWICEIAELLALTKTKEVEAVKGYITKQTDKYRRPFDKRTTSHKRQCMFIGTTNKEQFLTDKTGNRRFYPIRVSQNGHDLFAQKDIIKAEILQCWAEAKAKLDIGEMKPFANHKLLETIREHQLKAVEDDYRDGLISVYLENRQQVCILELWQKALDNGSFSKPTKRDSNDIALILQSISGWKRGDTAKRLPDYGVQKYWEKIEINQKKPVQVGIEEVNPFLQP